MSMKPRPVCPSLSLFPLLGQYILCQWSPKSNKWASWMRSKSSLDSFTDPRSENHHWLIFIFSYVCEARICVFLLWGPLSLTLFASLHLLAKLSPLAIGPKTPKPDFVEKPESCFPVRVSQTKRGEISRLSKTNAWFPKSSSHETRLTHFSWRILMYCIFTRDALFPEIVVGEAGLNVFRLKTSWQMTVQAFKCSWKCLDKTRFNVSSEESQRNSLSNRAFSQADALFPKNFSDDRISMRFVRTNRWEVRLQCASSPENETFLASWKNFQALCLGLFNRCTFQCETHLNAKRTSKRNALNFVWNLSWNFSITIGGGGKLPLFPGDLSTRAHWNTVWLNLSGNKANLIGRACVIP